MGFNYDKGQGLLQGLYAGLQSYGDATAKREDRERLGLIEKQKALRENAILQGKEGLVVNPDGSVTRDPVFDARAEEKRKQDLRDRIEVAQAGNAGLALTPGQKRGDETFGKEYADYSAGGGKAAVEKNLGLLSDAKNTLESAAATGKPISGGWTTKIPLLNSDVVQDTINPEKTKIKDQIRGAIQGSLKQVLGAQFTEKEGERIFNRAYNDRLSDSENARRAKVELEALKNMAAQKEAASDYFERTGSLVGFRATPMGTTQKRGGLIGGDAPSAAPLSPQEWLKQKRGQ